MTDEVLLAARKVTRYYGPRQALFAVDIHVARGEILGFLGANGAGKSTTMQILTGALAADAGTVEICGVDLAEQPLAGKARLGYLPEVPPLYGDMLVDDYLRSCARLRGVAAAACPQAVARARARCGLADVGGRLIAHLSKGYQQRVGIAQAIVHEPSVLIFDEPTAGLDPIQIRDMRELIRELGRDRGIMVSTHILPEIRALASRIVILHHGRVVHDAPVRNDGRVRARFRYDPGAAVLAAMAGVAGVQASANGWLLTVSEAEAAAEALAIHAVGAGWGLLELDPHHDDLEALFVQLTSGGDPAARAA